MPNYSTIEEKASKWNISVRHIQFLCRTGKIDGAIKRAGAWSIPDDAPNPAKNAKAGDKCFRFVGTKSKIFDCAIELSVLRGFANVSFKDIADRVGIRQSTVYSHFKTKQDILDAIYGFYCYYYIRERLGLKDMEPVIQEEGLADILKHIRYEFKGEYRKRMSGISKIIFQRIGFDERAREISSSLMVDEWTKNVESLFNHAVETGRLAPFDTHVLAVFINAVRIFALYRRVLAQDSSSAISDGLFEDEQALYKHALNYLSDLKPSGIGD